MKDVPVNSESPSSGSVPPSGPASGRRALIKRAIAVLAALGVLGAVGTYSVNKIIDYIEGGIEQPIKFDVREDPRGANDGFEVATRSADGLDAKLAGATSPDTLMVAAKSAGAADVAVVRESVLLEGGTRKDLSIVGMRAKILKREAVLAGALVYSQSAGAQEAIGVLFNLDETDPIARKINPNAGQSGAPYFGQGNTIRLEKGETQPFMLIGLSTRNYVEWEVEADVVIDGERQTFTINNDGKPFQVTGRPPDYPDSYGCYYQWKWAEDPEHLAKQQGYSAN